MGEKKLQAKNLFVVQGSVKSKHDDSILVKQRTSYMYAYKILKKKK